MTANSMRPPITVTTLKPLPPGELLAVLGGQGCCGGAVDSGCTDGALGVAVEGGFGAQFGSVNTKSAKGSDVKVTTGKPDDNKRKDEQVDSKDRLGARRRLKFSGLKGPWLRQELTATATGYELDEKKPPSCRVEKFRCVVKVVELFAVHEGETFNRAYSINALSPAVANGKVDKDGIIHWDIDTAANPDAPQVDTHHWSFDKAALAKCKICAIHVSVEAKLFDGVTFDDKDQMYGLKKVKGVRTPAGHIILREDATPKSQGTCDKTMCIVQQSLLNIPDMWTKGKHVANYGYDWFFEDCPCPGREPTDIVPPPPPPDVSTPPTPTTGGGGGGKKGPGKSPTTPGTGGGFVRGPQPPPGDVQPVERDVRPQDPADATVQLFGGPFGANLQQGMLRGRAHEELPTGAHFTPIRLERV